MTLEPPAAVNAGAAWEFSNQPPADLLSTGTLQEFNTNTVVVLQFLPISGWNLPTSQTLSLVPGQNPYTAYYTLAVSWSNPAPITYGTVLSSNQLRASTVNPQGTYAYSPTNGSVLNAGTNTLSVIFTPGDTANYGSTSATTNVSLVVLPASLTLTASNASRSFGQTNSVFGGTITGVTNNDNITVTYTCSATASSPAGMYPIIPTLVDPNHRLTNYTVTTNNGALTIIANGQLVQNDGFETGDFSFWTLSGTASDTGKANIYVNSASTYAHSGQYGAKLGPAGSLGCLSQALPTTVGQLYLLSLWLDSPDGQTPNEFSVAWNGITLFDQTNIGAIGWTNLQFSVSATTTNTVLQFGFRDDPSYLGLDDVSVLARPVLQNMTHTSSTITFSWSAQPGSVYQIQSATNLAQTKWTSVGGSMSASNSTMTTSAPITNAEQFYRVVLLP